MINNVNTLTILMKEMLKNISKMLSMILIVSGLVACNAFSDSTDPYAATEALKDLSGVWKLKSVVRNDVDITKEMDFTQFALHMNSDGTFHIDNYLPFVVERDGVWSIDDARHPQRITFQETGVQGDVQADFSYPIVEGRRSLSINLSPGCDKNKYTYTMERVAHK